MNTKGLFLEFIFKYNLDVKLQQFRRYSNLQQRHITFHPRFLPVFRQIGADQNHYRGKKTD